MEQCERCQIKYATFYCDSCPGYFCTSCDIYLHNLPSKKNHIRQALDVNQKDYYQDEQQNRSYGYINRPTTFSTRFYMPSSYKNINEDDKFIPSYSNYKQSLNISGEMEDNKRPFNVHDDSLDRGISQQMGMKLYEQRSQELSPQPQEKTKEENDFNLSSTVPRRPNQQQQEDNINRNIQRYKYKMYQQNLNNIIANDENTNNEQMPEPQKYSKKLYQKYLNLKNVDKCESPNPLNRSNEINTNNNPTNINVVNVADEGNNNQSQDNKHISKDVVNQSINIPKQDEPIRTKHLNKSVERRDKTPKIVRNEEKDKMLLKSEKRPTTQIHLPKDDKEISGDEGKQTHQNRFMSQTIEFADKTYPYIKEQYTMNSDNPENKLNFLENTAPNFKSFTYSMKPHECMTNKYVGEIRNIYENEKHGLMHQIHMLSHEVADTKQDLGEKINILHDHLHEVDMQHKEEMVNLNNKNLSEINYLNNQNENQQRHLQAIIEDQRDLINKLKIKNAEYEVAVEDYKKIKDHLCEELLAFKNEKFNMESFYKNKIDEIVRMYENEKKKMIRDHENEMRRANDDYTNKKEKLLNVIQEREDQLKEILNNSKAEKEQMTAVINNLKKDIDDKKKDNDNLNKFNDELQENIANLNDNIVNLQTKIEDTTKDRNDMEMKLEKIHEQNKQFKRANTQLHDVLFGRFGRKDSVKKDNNKHDVKRRPSKMSK